MNWVKISEQLPPLNTKVLLLDWYGEICIAKLMEFNKDDYWWDVDQDSDSKIAESDYWSLITYPNKDGN